VARIDAPLLNFIYITFFHQLIFNIPQFAPFMKHTPISFQTFNDAHVDFYSDRVGFRHSGRQHIRLDISCLELDWQLLSLAQVLTWFFPSIYNVEHLEIRGYPYSLLRWEDEIESIQFLEIIQQFTAVKHISASRGSAQGIALALQELVGERALDALPALERLSLREFQSLGPAREAIGKFVAARDPSGHPVAVDYADWEGT
jgi:hypothetical protein